MRFSVCTLFPEYFDSPFSTSILGRARDQGLLAFDFVKLREFGEGKYRAVDDKQYGGGAGMVMMPTVLERALQSILQTQSAEALEQDVASYRAAGTRSDESLPYVVYLSPQGRRLDARSARELAKKPHITLICGHYEGIDERAIEAFVHEEISIGDYVLTGGEPAAAVLIDAVARFVPGVVGDQLSVESDTFEAAQGGATGHTLEMHPGGLKYPVFTKPAAWRGREVPPILLSGNHAEIAKWRRQQSHLRTANRRPDLL